METGFGGTFVIPWSNSWIDGERNPPRDALVPGAVWAWQGRPMRVDGPDSVLPLGQAKNTVMARKKRGHGPKPFYEDDVLRDSFVLTDGLQTYSIAVIRTRAGMPEVLLFQGRIPPRDMRLWVIDCTYTEASADVIAPVVGLSAEAEVTTPDRRVLVGEIKAGTKVVSRHGVQEVVWVGRQEFGTGHLYMTPSARPYRSADGGYLLGSGQNILTKHANFAPLFGTNEALVSVQDASRSFGFARDLSLDSVVLYQILLEQPSAILIQNDWLESYIADDKNLSRLGAADRARLVKAWKANGKREIGAMAHSFRKLSTAEAAIALSDVA